MGHWITVDGRHVFISAGLDSKSYPSTDAQKAGVENVKSQFAAAKGKLVGEHHSTAQGGDEHYLAYDVTNPKNPKDVRTVVFSVDPDGKITRA